MAKSIYKIIKNMPSYNSYAQYVYKPDAIEFHDATGMNTVLTNDDLYN